MCGSKCVELSSDRYQVCLRKRIYGEKAKRKLFCLKNLSFYYFKLPSWHFHSITSIQVVTRRMIGSETMVAKQSDKGLVSEPLTGLGRVSKIVVAVVVAVAVVEKAAQTIVEGKVIE